MGAAYALDRMNGGRHVNGDHAQALHALLALHSIAGDAGAFQRGIETVSLQAAQMQKNILRAIIGNNETIATRTIKPLHETSDAIDFRAGFK